MKEMQAPEEWWQKIAWWEEYTAQLQDVLCARGPCQHLKVRRRDGKEITASWDLLQAIKNDLAGPEEFAVEIYPGESRLVNEVNLRHLWIIPREWVPVGLVSNPELESG